LRWLWKLRFYCCLNGDKQILSGVHIVNFELAVGNIGRYSTKPAAVNVTI